MRYGSVCSGIEAATVAWHPLGWEPAFFSEIEPAPRSVLAHHYPDVPCHGDFTTIGADDYGSINLLVGGTPCQSFSVAGLRGGLDDDRGNLALEFLRLAQRKRPKWLVWENVPGVLSSNGGRDFGSFLGMLAELRYGFAYRILDAQYFGVAQRRRRVFVVGHAGDWRRAAAVLFERHSLSGNPAPSRETGKAAPTIPARSTAGGGLGTDFDCDGGLIPQTVGALTDGAHMGGGSTDRTPTPAEYLPSLSLCLNAGGMGRQDAETETLIPINGGGFDVAHSLGGEGFDASEDGTGRGTPLVPIQFQATMSTPHVDFDICQTLGAMNPQAVAFTQNQRDEVRTLHVAGALAAEPGAKQQTYLAFSVAPGYCGGDKSGQDVAHVNTIDVSRTLDCTGADVTRKQGGVGIAVAFTASEQANSYAWEREYAPTLNAQAPNDTSNIQTGVRIGMQVRRLTPTECERLQGFPDDFTAIPYRGKPASQCPDGPRYKALGNSMAVPVMAWIGRRIAAVDAISAMKTQQAKVGF